MSKKQSAFKQWFENKAFQTPAIFETYEIAQREAWNAAIEKVIDTIKPTGLAEITIKKLKEND